MTIHAIRRKAQPPDDGPAELDKLLKGETVPISAALCEELNRRGLKVKPARAQDSSTALIVSVETERAEW